MPARLLFFWKLSTQHAIIPDTTFIKFDWYVSPPRLVKGSLYALVDFQAFCTVLDGLIISNLLRTIVPIDSVKKIQKWTRNSQALSKMIIWRVLVEPHDSVFVSGRGHTSLAYWVRNQENNGKWRKKRCGTRLKWKRNGKVLTYSTVQDQDLPDPGFRVGVTVYATGEVGLLRVTSSNKPRKETNTTRPFSATTCQHNNNRTSQQHGEFFQFTGPVMRLVFP